MRYQQVTRNEAARNLRQYLTGFVHQTSSGFIIQAGFKIRIASWIARELGKSQKEGQEDQGTLKKLGRGPPQLFYLSMVIPALLLALPGLPGYPSGYPYLEAC